MAYNRAPNTVIVGTGLTQTPLSTNKVPPGSVPVNIDANIASTTNLGVVQIGDNINVTPGGVISVSTLFGFGGYYGSFFDTTTQTNPVVGDPNIVTFTSTAASNQVSVVGGSQATVVNPGVYNIQFSAQVEKPTAAVHTVFIWLRLNGVDVPSSASEITVLGSTSRSVPAWNFMIPMNGGDYVELVWSSDFDTMTLLAQPAAPPVPDIPSIILTINQVSGL